MLQRWYHTGLWVDEPLTSDLTADTQVGCQDPRRTDVKSQTSVSAINISTSNTLFAFVSGTTVAGVKALRMLYHPVAQPHGIFAPDSRQSHCWAAVTVVQPSVSDLNLFSISNVPAVIGNCILPLSVLHECSFAMCSVRYARRNVGYVNHHMTLCNHICSSRPSSAEPGSCDSVPLVSFPSSDLRGVSGK